MKKFLLFALFFMVAGCGYHIVRPLSVAVELRRVKSNFSELPGIESELTRELIKSFSSRGIVLKRHACLGVYVTLLGISSSEYFYDSSGRISRVRANAKYRVKIEDCHGKNIERIFSIPLSYWYYAEPYPTESSKAGSILEAVDLLVEKIIEVIGEAS